MVIDEVIGLVDVQLVGRDVGELGLTCLKRAVNRDPTRREGARMKEMPAKIKKPKRTSRIRERVARLERYQASPPGMLHFIECSAVSAEKCCSIAYMYSSRCALHLRFLTESGKSPLLPRLRALQSRYITIKLVNTESLVVVNICL